MAVLIIQLKEEYKNILRKDQLLKGLVAEATGKTIYTVDTWLRDNNKLLTLPAVLITIRQRLNLDASIELTEELDQE